MARNPHSNSEEQAIDEEDYIDMDINNMCSSIPSSPNSREFEFQNFSNILLKNNIPSPADELFYKGKLLPLQLPPRMQMVEKLLRKPTNYNTATSTPFESCNISPVNSCYVSGELNPEEFYYECHKENTKKSWTKLKKFNLKLKASKAYLNLKSLFIKEKKIPFSKKIHKTTNVVEEECGNRRSFSMKRHVSNKSTSTSSSSCSSSNSSSFSSVNSNSNAMLKRSSSVNSDNECSIQGAIAYCKKSQQQACGRKSVSDVEFYINLGAKFDVEYEKK